MDFTTIQMSYGVCFGKGDGGDPIDYDYQLNKEQQKQFKEAVMTRKDFSEFPALAGIEDEVYKDAEESEIEVLLYDIGDEFTKECLGENEVDIEEINNLVHKKDKHAIEFFELSDLSDDELESWDVEYECDIPKVKEFYEDFSPMSPFESGWELNIFMRDIDDYELDESEIMDYLKELILNGEIEKAHEVVTAQEKHWGKDIPLAESASEIAHSLGCDWDT